MRKSKEKFFELQVFETKSPHELLAFTLASYRGSFTLNLFFLRYGGFFNHLTDIQFLYFSKKRLFSPQSLSLEERATFFEEKMLIVKNNRRWFVKQWIIWRERKKYLFLNGRQSKFYWSFWEFRDSQGCLKEVEGGLVGSKRFMKGGERIIRNEEDIVFWKEFFFPKGKMGL